MARGHFALDRAYFTGRNGTAPPRAPRHNPIRRASPRRRRTLIAREEFENTDFVAAFPLRVTRELVEHGRNRYMIYCVVCHDALGTGQGGVMIDWLKDRIKKPKVLVDLSGIDELKGIRTTSDGLEIGAMTTLTEIANHPEIKAKYGVLSDAVELVASPQIRNQGTLGGNVSQDVRCWYYRGGWPCYRAGGNICYADTPVGRNREHAIFGADSAWRFTL